MKNIYKYIKNVLLEHSSFNSTRIRLTIKRNILYLQEKIFQLTHWW